MSERSLGGEGDLNLPYEDDPGAAAGNPIMTELVDPQLATALVMVAIVIAHPFNGEPHPAVIYRFSNGDGTFQKDVVLLVEKDELSMLKKLTGDTIEGALRGAARAAKGGWR